MSAVERDRLREAAAPTTPVHTSRRIEEAALKLFYERGYAETTMREIALACGLTPGALYNHFASKEELLRTIQLDIHRWLEALLEDALEDAGDHPADQVRAFCRAHALMHATYQTEALVANRELRSLTEESLAEVMAIRDRMVRRFIDIVQRGKDEGIFDVPDADAVGKLVLSMAVSIAVWFRPDDALSREEMADIDATTALRMVGYQNEKGGRS